MVSQEGRLCDRTKAAENKRKTALNREMYCVGMYVFRRQVGAANGFGAAGDMG